MGKPQCSSSLGRTNNSETYDKDLEAQKTEKVKEHRPVEKSEQGHQPGLGAKSEEQLQSHNNIEDGKLVVEQYDGSGRLVKVTPPGYLLPGQSV